MDGAYAVQAINTRFGKRGPADRRAQGRADREGGAEQLSIDQSDFGVLFDDVENADGGTIQPKVEAEVVRVNQGPSPR